mmetsp:Transcript_8758/g.24702  ORF Transcript_8758/g.24702 Transcript_8758/m.24702 type:complete len:188 (+) Transcript_8758:171-734(+)
MFAFGECCCAQHDVANEQVFDVPIGELLSMAPGEPSTPHVPQDFSMRSINSAASSGSGSALDREQRTRDMARMRNMVRDFAVEFLQGVYLDAVLEDGSLVPCRCTMDSKLTVLILEVRSTTRRVELAGVADICTGRDLRNLQTTTPLDDLCVTLVMTDDKCISFKLGDVQGREHFATCMKVLRLALE